MTDDSIADCKEVGVVCSLVQQDDGRVRLSLDDAAAFALNSGQMWEVLRSFTWRDYDKAAFFNTEFSEQELADIGLSLVTRLAALAASRKRE